MSDETRALWNFLICFLGLYVCIWGVYACWLLIKKEQNCNVFLHYLGFEWVDHTTSLFNPSKSIIFN